MGSSPFVSARAVEGLEVPLGTNDFQMRVIQELTRMNTQLEKLDEVPEKLTRLETQMAALMGNGQPGLIAKIEERISQARERADKEIAKVRNEAGEVRVEQGHQRGIAAGISFCVAVVVSLVIALFKSAGK